MIKMMIADDEKIIREGILHIVEWAQYGIEMVGAAVDGKQAQVLFEEHRPDIVLTDVRMPNVDGLELTRCIRSLDEHTKVIILSGYDEFAYAQQALRYGACDYLLKPVMPDKLVEKVLEIRDQVLFEQNERQEREKLLHRLAESLPVQQERFLQELVAGAVTDQELIMKQIEQLQLHLSAVHPCCAVIIDPEFPLVDVQLAYRILELLKDKAGGIGEAVRLPQGQFGLVIQYADLQDHCDFPIVLKQLCEELQEEWLDLFGINPTFGIGTTSRTLSLMSHSMKAAVEALKHKTIVGSGQIILFAEITLPLPPAEDEAEEANRELLLAITNADGNALDIHLAHYLRPAASSSDLDYGLMLSMRLLDRISTQLPGQFEDRREVIGTDYEIWELLRSCTTLPDLHAELLKMLQRLAAYLTESREKRPHRWIEQALAYLQEHYNEPLSLRKLADTVFLSPNYMCSLFKEETGQNISDYLTRLRIEKAKELLGVNGMKIYEVANQVGYTDSRYFNKVFKKYTGMNLSEYRAKQ